MLYKWTIWRDTNYRVSIYITEEIKENAIQMTIPKKCVRINLQKVKLSPLSKKKYTR